MRSMKKSLLATAMVACLAAQSFGSILLGGFDGEGSGTTLKQDASVVGSVDVTLSNLDLQLLGGTTATTWGSLTLTPAAGDTAGNALARSGTPSLTLTIDNNFTSTSLSLDAVHIAVMGHANAVSLMHLTYLSGDLDDADGTVAVADEGLLAGWNDYDLSLASLSDFVLDPGESATFSVTTSDKIGGTWANLDNVAITGTIPEPATVGLLGLGAIALMALRRLQR